MSYLCLEQITPNCLPSEEINDMINNHIKYLEVRHYTGTYFVPAYLLKSIVNQSNMYHFTPSDN